MSLPLAFLNLGFGEMALLAVIALLLYGSDLPEVAKAWGKTYQEFRRHLNGFRNDLNDVIYSENDSPRKLQYYPEFHNDVTESDTADNVDDAASTEPATPSVPIASTPATGTKLAEADETVRGDAHGAA
jgi:sec-independent protein translocase protein TatA